MRSRKNIQLYQASIARKKRKSKSKAKARRRNLPRKVRVTRHKSSYRHPYIKPFQTLLLESDFRIVSNPALVIKQLNTILKARGKNAKSIRLDLDLRNVVHFDLGALTCLLSTLRFTTNYAGNLPTDPTCRIFFEESGFLSLMRDINGNLFKSPNSNNLMFEKGTDKTSNRKVGEEIKKAIKHLTGNESTFPPVYSIIQEICPNSIEHANSKVKDINWMMGIHYEDDKVCFAMADKGYGILKTIKKSLPQKVLDKFRDEKEILLSAFSKEYQSQTEDDNRNKGLPRIKLVADKGYVQNMIVITNSTLLNLSNPEDSQLLGANFGGTFYYWEITKETYQRWKHKKQSPTIS